MIANVYPVPYVLNAWMRCHSFITSSSFQVFNKFNKFKRLKKRRKKKSNNSNDTADPVTGLLGLQTRDHHPWRTWPVTFKRPGVLHTSLEPFWQAFILLQTLVDLVATGSSIICSTFRNSKKKDKRRKLPCYTRHLNERMKNSLCLAVKFAPDKGKRDSVILMCDITKPRALWSGSSFSYHAQTDQSWSKASLVIPWHKLSR